MNLNTPLLMDKEKKNYSQLHLVKVVDLGTSEEVNTSEIDAIGVAHKMMQNLEHKIVKMTIQVVLKNKEEQEIGTSKYDFVFEIPNLDDFHTMEDDKVKFESTLASVLIGISYSTLRGILLQYWKGTDFVLPIIEPGKILSTKL